MTEMPAGTTNVRSGVPPAPDTAWCRTPSADPAVADMLLLFWLPTPVQPVLLTAVVAVMREAKQATSKSPSATPAGSVSVMACGRGLDNGADTDDGPRRAGKDVQIWIVSRASMISCLEDNAT